MVKLNEMPEMEPEFESDAYESDEWETYEDDDSVEYDEDGASGIMKYAMIGGGILALILIIIVTRMVTTPPATTETASELSIPDTTSIISESVVDTQMPEEEPKAPEYTHKVPSEQLTPGEDDEVFKATALLGGGTKASDDDRQLVYDAVIGQFEAVKKGVQTGTSVNLKMDNRAVVDKLAMMYNSGYDVVPASFTVFEGTTTEDIKYIVLFEKGDDKIGIFGQYNKVKPLVVVDGMVDEEAVSEDADTSKPE